MRPALNKNRAVLVQIVFHPGDSTSRDIGFPQSATDEGEDVPNLKPIEIILLLLVVVIPTLIVIGVVWLATKGSRTRQPPIQPPPPGTPAAGWYPDPITPGKQRYWDGGRWTEDLTDA